MVIIYEIKHFGKRGPGYIITVSASASVERSIGGWWGGVEVGSVCAKAKPSTRK